ERDPQGGARAGAGKKTDLAVQLCALGRFPMKQVTDTLGLARSNIAERVKGARPKRGPQTRDGDLELTATIRRLVDARPTYGYRRIAALLKRERRSDGLAALTCPRETGPLRAGKFYFSRLGRAEKLDEEVAVQRAADCVCATAGRGGHADHRGLPPGRDQRGVVLQLAQKVWRPGAVGDEAAEA